ISAPRFSMVCCTSRRRWSSWLCMITSLSTMATMRSSGRTCAVAEVASRRLASSRAPSVSGRRVSESMIFTFTVTLYAFVEECLSGAADDVAEAVGHDLQENSGIRLVVHIGVEIGLVVIDPVAVDQAQLPAAAVVLEATEGFQRAAAAVIVLPAPDHAPLRDHRPDEREVMLVDLVVVLDVIGLARGSEVAVIGPLAAGLVVTHGVVAVAIADVDDLVRVVGRLVVPHGAAGAGAVAVRVPVEGRS